MYANDIYILMLCVSVGDANYVGLTLGVSALSGQLLIVTFYKFVRWYCGGIFLIRTISYEHWFTKFRGPVSY